MSRMDFIGLQGLALVGLAICGSVQAGSSAPVAEDVIALAPHGIQFNWRETHRIQRERKPDGSCEFKDTERILREENSCILRVEIARDPATCSSVVERGEPVNRNRCRVDGFYAHYIPGTQTSTLLSGKDMRDADNGAYIEMLVSAFAGVFVAPTFYTLVARSTVNPHSSTSIEEIENQAAISPPYRGPAARQVADSIQTGSGLAEQDQTPQRKPGES